MAKKLVKFMKLLQTKKLLNQMKSKEKNFSKDIGLEENATIVGKGLSYAYYHNLIQPKPYSAFQKQREPEESETKPAKPATSKVFKDEVKNFEYAKEKLKKYKSREQHKSKNNLSNSEESNDERKKKGPPEAKKRKVIVSEIEEFKADFRTGIFTTEASAKPNETAENE